LKEEVRTGLKVEGEQSPETQSKSVM